MRSRDPEKMVIRTGLPDYAAVSARRRAALAGVLNPANAGLTGLAAASGTALSPTDAASTANTARAARSRTPTIARTISPIHRLHAENPFIGRSSTPPGPSCTRRVRDITPSPAIRGPNRDANQTQPAVSLERSSRTLFCRYSRPGWTIWGCVPNDRIWGMATPRVSRCGRHGQRSTVVGSPPHLTP